MREAESIPIAGPGSPDASHPDLGVIWHGNLLEESPPDGPIVAWSGWAGGQPRLAGGVWSPAFETWGPAGRAAFDERIGSLARSGARVLIRPHARHVISDIPSVATLAKRFEGGSVGVLLEPAALFTSEMLRDTDEHIERIAALVSVCAGVLLSDIERAGEELRLIAGAGELAGRLEAIRAAAEAAGVACYGASPVP